MRSLHYVLAFLFCAATVARASICMTLYPDSTRCRPNYDSEAPLITSNLACGKCTSLRALKNLMYNTENNSVAAVEFNDGTYPGDYDLKLDCAAGTVSIFRARSQSPVCSGEFVKKHLGDCLLIGHDSVQLGVDQCNYTLYSASASNFVAEDPVACGWMPDSYMHTCDECLELPDTNSMIGLNYIQTSCQTGRSTVYSDVDCTAAVDHFDMNECKYFRTWTPSSGAAGSLRVMPKTVQALSVCQGIFTNFYCGGSPSSLTSVPYFDAAAPCGTCFSLGTYELDIWFTGLGSTSTSRTTVASFTVDCYSRGVTLYSGATCSRETKITGEYPAGANGLCLPFQDYSLWVSDECPSWSTST